MADERIGKLRAAHPDLDEAISLTKDFVTLVRACDSEAVDCWLDQAVARSLEPFRSFDSSLHRDYDAVYAGVELP